jgi:hypothetical protein
VENTIEIVRELGRLAYESAVVARKLHEFHAELFGQCYGPGVG